MSKEDFLATSFDNLKTIYEIGQKITPISESYANRAGALRTLQLENIGLIKDSFVF